MVQMALGLGWYVMKVVDDALREVVSLLEKKAKGTS